MAGYHPSCLEVHDRWVGIQSNHLEDEDDNVSRKVNINMEIGRGKERERESGYGSSDLQVEQQVAARKVPSLARSHSQPSHRFRNINKTNNNNNSKSHGQYLVMKCKA